MVGQQNSLNLPKRVAVELTNRCNRACRECPRHKTNYPLGNMKWRLFNDIIEQLPQSTVIVPFFRGEPLLYPQFPQAMRKLRYFDNVQVATNGDLLNDKTEKALLSCSFVSLSLHKYASPSGNRRLNFLRNARNNGTTTQVSIVDTLIPKKRKQSFVETWLEHADRVRIYVEHSQNGYGSTRLKIDDRGQPCSKPFSDMVVYWDGKAALCCHDWNNQLNLGNLNTESISEVWTGQPYENVRVKHLNGKRRTVKSCVNCDQWMADYMPSGILGELHTNA